MKEVRDEGSGLLFVHRPTEHEKMTIFQRVGDWKEHHYIGQFTMGLIDELSLRIIELEQHISMLKRAIPGSTPQLFPKDI